MPADEPPRDGFATWPKKTDRRCTAFLGVYATTVSAQTACVSNHECVAVYGSAGAFATCDASGVVDSGGDHVLLLKPTGTLAADTPRHTRVVLRHAMINLSPPPPPTVSICLLLCSVAVDMSKCASKLKSRASRAGDASSIPCRASNIRLLPCPSLACPPVSNHCRCHQLSLVGHACVFVL